MSQWNTRLDEEQQILYLQDTVIRRKNLLEQQRATFGPLNLPPHIQIEIEYLEEELTRLKQRLAVARRRKRRQQTMQQVAHAAGGITRLVIPSHRPIRGRRRGFIERLRTLAVRLVVVTIFIGIILLVGWWQTRSLVGPALSSSPPLSTPLRANGSDRRIVTNTGGIGVRFRLAPQQEATYEIALEDGTTVYLIERLVDADGEAWWKVELQDGSPGYIKERYLGMP